MTDKTITTFQQRRQLESAFIGMAKIENELGLIQLAQALVKEHPTELILPPFLKHLGTVDSQVRGGLGHLATLLPAEEIRPVLRSATANRQLDPAARFNAAMIIERFLGEEIPVGALADLNDTNELAFQSLCEAVDEGKRDRHILYEYVSQLREESEEISLIVLEQLQRLSSTDRLELLRLIAQDDRPMVAIGALEYLELIEPTDAGAGLLRTLHTLQFTIPPEHAQRVERHLRKLRFRGQPYTAPDASRWRALITPAEASGNQSIWFFEQTEEATGAFLSIILNRVGGILKTLAVEEMHKEDLPQNHAIGELFSISVGPGGGQTLVFLEVPFDYGRWLVQQALSAHWEGASWRELFDEYTLYNDLIWQFEAPQLAAEITALYAYAVSENDSEKSSTAQQTTEKVAEQVAAQMRVVEELLHHPVMVGWVFEVRALLSTYYDTIVSNTVASDDGPSNTKRTMTLLHELTAVPGGAEMLSGIQAGLEAQAGWLHIAGSPQTGGYALQIARSIDPEKPENNLFLLELFGRVLGEK